MCTTRVQSDFKIWRKARLGKPTPHNVSAWPHVLPETSSGLVQTWRWWVMEGQPVLCLSCLCPGGAAPRPYRVPLHAQWQLLGPGCQSPNYPATWPSPAFSTWRTPPGSINGIKNINIYYTFPSYPAGNPTPACPDFTSREVMRLCQERNGLEPRGSQLSGLLGLGGTQGVTDVVTSQAAALCSHMLSSAMMMLLHEINLTVPEEKQICLQNHHLFLISSSIREQLTGSEGNNKLSLRR